MSTKQKKIKFRLYLQNTLAAHPLHDDQYPLYLYINFIGQNTKLSITENDQTVYWNQALLDQYKTGKREGRNFPDFDRIDNKLKVIEYVLRYEYQTQQEKYSLKGLRDRLEAYEEDLMELIADKSRELLFLEFKCLYPEIDLNDGLSLAMMNAAQKLHVEDHIPSPLVQTYLELFVGLYLFSEGVFNENAPSMYQRMIIYWLKDEEMMTDFFGFLRQITNDKERLIKIAEGIKGFSKINLDLINQYFPTIEKREIYKILLKKEES